MTGLIGFERARAQALQRGAGAARDEDRGRSEDEGATKFSADARLHHRGAPRAEETPVRSGVTPS